MQSPELAPAAEPILPGIAEEKPNDQSAEAATEPKASYSEKILSNVKGIFERGGVMFKRGGGRPRKDGQPNKRDIPLNAAPLNLPALAATDSPDTPKALDPSLVKRCCTAILKAVDGLCGGILAKKARQVGYNPAEIKQLCVDNAVTQAEADSFSELAVICLQKYGVGTQYAPEIGLAVIAAGIGVRYATAFGTLNAEIKKKMEPPGTKPNEN